MAGIPPLAPHRAPNHRQTLPHPGASRERTLHLPLPPFLSPFTYGWWLQVISKLPILEGCS